MTIERKSVPITRDTVRDSSASRRLGLSLIDLPEGTALCNDARSLTCITAADQASGEEFLIVIGVAEFEQGVFGSLSPMTPNQARNFAASLIEGANQIDGGAVQ